MTWTGNSLLGDAQGPSLKHTYRAVTHRMGTAVSKHYIILTAKLVVYSSCLFFSLIINIQLI